MFNFDEVIDRSQTDSTKWRKLRDQYNEPDLLPMWVADMDFKVAEPISNALEKRANHGIFGYVYPHESFYLTFIDWVQKRHGWKIEKDWILVLPGVISGLNLSARVLAKEGENMILQSPVYPPFYRVIENNHRNVIDNPLVLNDGKYEIDFDDLENKIDSNTKALLFCSPHNPVGRVWKKDELIKLSRICLQHQIIMVSDEIHSDLIYPDNTHIPLASLSHEIAQQTVTLMAPSKTFNIAGLATSVAIIPDAELRKKYQQEMVEMAISSHSTFGTLAFETAYSQGEEWLEELLCYLNKNKKRVAEFLEEELRDVHVIDAEGTYLLWLDFRKLEKSHDQIRQSLIHHGKVALNSGLDFGQQGACFFRMNIACPRSTLEEGLSRIKKAVLYLKEKKKDEK